MTAQLKRQSHKHNGETRLLYSGEEYSWSIAALALAITSTGSTPGQCTYPRAANSSSIARVMIGTECAELAVAGILRNLETYGR
eukprot:COSAG02_NODE_57285_length_281_cov_0.752747_1_plen_83_part_01